MRYIAALLVVLALGCDKKDNPVAPPPNPDLNGRWSGSSSGLTMSLTLTDAFTVVSGSGSMTITNSIAFSVSGSDVYPNISLTLTSPGFQAVNITGRFSDRNTIPAKINGGGFVDWPITLVRQ